IAVREQRFDDARQLLEEALALSRPMGYWAVMVASLAQLSGLARAQSNVPLAREYGRACLATAQEIGDLGLMAAAAAVFADVEFDLGRFADGVRLLGAENAWRAGLGRRFVSFWSWPAPDPSVARARLGDTAFEDAFSAGQALSLRRAVAEALDGL